MLDKNIGNVKLVNDIDYDVFNSRANKHLEELNISIEDFVSNSDFVLTNELKEKDIELYNELIKLKEVYLKEHPKPAYKQGTLDLEFEDDSPLDLDKETKHKMDVLKDIHKD